jgi:PAS domain S-box-containing protein
MDFVPSEKYQTGDLPARLSAILEPDDDAIICQTVEGVITGWNHTAESIFGFSADEMIGRHFSILYPPGHDLKDSPATGRIWSDKSSDRYETVLQGKDGRRLHLVLTEIPFKDAAGKILGISTVARDLTERRFLQKSLQTSLQEVINLKAALDEHAIVAITDPQGRITYANDKFCAISKYTLAELLGQDHRLINSGFHPHEFIHDLWNTITQGRVWHGEIKNKAKDGTFYWVDTTIKPFVDRHGKIFQYVSVRTDITTRKRIEEEIQKLNDELEQRVCDRTAELKASNQELEGFSYSVSHDLRAPIRHINGFAKLLRDAAQPGLSEKAVHYLDTISNAAEKMGQLIDALLAFSRMGRADLRLSPTNLNQLATETVHNPQPEMLGRNIQWTIGRLPEAPADPTMLRLVFINLLSNAIKYTLPRNPANIEIGSQADSDGEIVIFVRDNGVGFDMQYANKLFNVFQRLHSEECFEGTGIGLANIRRIINRHGGRTWAEGKTDGGATFYFSLPKNAVNSLP